MSIMAYEPEQDPFRLRVQKGLCELLENINPSNGFKGDLKGNVFRGRDAFGDNDPEYMLSILEPPIAPDQRPAPRNSTSSSGPYDLVIQGFLPDDRCNPTDPAHELMAAVKWVLGQEKKRCQGLMGRRGANGGQLNMIVKDSPGNRVEDMQIGAGVVRPPDEISGKAYFWLTLTLMLVENTENPYG